MKGESRDYILSLDQQRRNYHREVASQLVAEDIAPSQVLAVALVRQIAYNQGYDKNKPTDPQAARDREYLIAA